MLVTSGGRELLGTRRKVTKTTHCIQNIQFQFNSELLRNAQIYLILVWSKYAVSIL